MHETASEGITLRQVRYRFSGSQAVQGGPCGISLSLPRTGLVGVVGQAGAGKSTLVRLILGPAVRMAPSSTCRTLHLH